MEAVIVGHLRVEGGADQVALFDRDDAPVVQSGQGGDIRPDPLNDRRTDEDRVERRITDRWNRQVNFERVGLRTEGISAHINVDTAKALLAVDTVKYSGRQHDQSRTGSINRQPAVDRLFQRLLQAEQAGQFVHDTRFPARNDEAIDLFQFGGSPDRDGVCTELAQDFEVFTEVALECKHTDPRSSSFRGVTSHAQKAGVVPQGLTR